MTGWSDELTAFTEGHLDVPPPLAQALERLGVRVEPRKIQRLITNGESALRAVELEDGAQVACDSLVVRPPQRQVDVVQSLNLALDERGYVRVDDQAQTSMPGIYAAGDLTTMMQSALGAAAAGALAAARINMALNLARPAR